VHWKITALWGGKKGELRETQRAVTPFGGLVVFFEFLRRSCRTFSGHLPKHSSGRCRDSPNDLFLHWSRRNGNRNWRLPGFLTKESLR